MKKKSYVVNQISPGWNAAFMCLMVFLALLVLLPVLLVIVVSFSSADSISKNGYSFFPTEWSIAGYAAAFKMGDSLLYSFIVTILRSVTFTVFSVTVMMLFAYVVCQKKFWLERPLVWWLFVPMLFSGGLIPAYMFITRYYGLKDTFWVLILPGSVVPSYVIILRTFIRTSIPSSLIESAELDGANHFAIFSKIVVPLSKAGMATIALFNFVGSWNDWFTGMLYIKNPKLVPLQTLLTKLQNSVDYLKNNSRLAGTKEGYEMLKNLPGTNLRMACTVLAIIPIIFAYPFFQRYFVTGLTVGGIKE